MATEELSRAKQALRRRMLAARSQVSPETVASASAAVWRRLRELPLLQRARTIHTYVGALPGEIRTDHLVAWCLERRCTVIVPAVDVRTRTMRHVVLEALDALSPTAWGGMEPVGGAPADPARADVIIVPGVAFDRSGHRLGMGGGFYDRLLAVAKVPAIGLAHAWQIVDAVPTGPGDAAVSLIVTPEEIVIPPEKETAR